MTTDEARRAIKSLSEKIRRHQHEYYVLNTPSISDLEYDRFFDRLTSLEKKFPDLTQPDSPTQRVGSDISQDFPEVEHTVPVLSLEKAYNANELAEWIIKTEKAWGTPLAFVFEEKIDGTSIVLYYENGVLRRAVTRGNGIIGNDVTGNVKTISCVPLRLTQPITVAVRGEIFLPRRLFEEINSKMDQQYANPRNLAAGTLRRVKSANVAVVPLDIFINEGYFDNPPSTHVAILEELEQLGFKLNQNIGFFSDKEDLQSIRNQHRQWLVGRKNEIVSFLQTAINKRRSIDYEIDGIVIKINEIEARAELGYTGHHPRWAIAFKFESPEGLSKVNSIDVQIGRTGRITPVARIQPVHISGSTISNVTLHNQEYIDMLELALGDKVAVSKRGDVIPAIERVIEKNEDGHTTWRIPELCPQCHSHLRAVGSHRFCPNDDCAARLKGRLHFFCARGQMDIENLGPETLDFLFDKGFIHDVQDIYSFDFENLKDLHGFGEKKIKLIKHGIEKSKKRSYRTVLQSLGIPEVGQNIIDLLSKSGYGDIESLLSLAESRNASALESIHGIGGKIASVLVRELTNPVMKRRITDLRKFGLRFSEEDSLGHDEKKVKIEQNMTNQTWCVTGSFARFRPRERAMDEIRKRGGHITTNVTSKTTHLLAGEAVGSKLQKARSLGVKIVNEAEFIEQLVSDKT